MGLQAAGCACLPVPHPAPSRMPNLHMTSYRVFARCADPARVVSNCVLSSTDQGPTSCLPSVGTFKVYEVDTLSVALLLLFPNCKQLLDDMFAPSAHMLRPAG